MRYIKLFGFILSTLLSGAVQGEEYEIKGKVTDFNGEAIDSVTIKLMNKKFETLYETLSDKDGNYAMTVVEGDYNCLYAIKSSDYRVSKLEYWNWNVPVHQDMTINPQYNNLEIYGVNVFEPQVSPRETYMIYFRPMSLKKTLQVASKDKVDKKDFKNIARTEDLLDRTNKLINISPDSITMQELTIEINDNKAEILSIGKLSEYARGFYLYGYFVQVRKPEQNNNRLMGYDLISITLNSVETGEIGKSETFVRKTD
jgi:hypothetical protein